MRRLRSVAVYLALVALMLRALVPVGWMSTAAAGATHPTLMPCPMMDGMPGMAMQKQQDEPQHPAKHQLPASHEGSICSFATAGLPVRVILPDRIEIAPARISFFGLAPSSLARNWDHAARAPPPAA